jgi:hypothetical protein
MCSCRLDHLSLSPVPAGSMGTASRPFNNRDAGLGALPGKRKRSGSRIVMFVFGRNFFMRAE